MAEIQVGCGVGQGNVRCRGGEGLAAAKRKSKLRRGALRVGRDVVFSK